MTTRKMQIINGLALSFCILTSISFPLLAKLIMADNFNSNSPDYPTGTFITSVNGKNYLAKYITEKDVGAMNDKLESSSSRSEHDQNLVIDGHGTGYEVPTSADLESLIGKVSLLKQIPESGQAYRASSDLSSQIYFPVVGDQGTQGSCSAWANAYYAYGYLEAKDYGWDASSGNPDYLLSPAWAYNIVTATDSGSIPYEVAQVMLDWGIPTLSAMPYDDSDVNSWGDELAWRQAPYHRPLGYSLLTYNASSTIDTIKSLLDSGTPVTIGIDAYQFNNGLDQSSNDYILSSGEYIPDQGLNHAQCLVGYDDAITEGSDVGAFRVVNSWGASWMDGGYYWLTYDAFKEFADDSGQVLMYITDRVDYNPDLIATWEFSSSPTRMADIVTLGVGPHNSPLDTITPSYAYDTNNLFPSFMALDISDFYSYYTSDNDVFFFLDIGSSDITGTISSFRLERYSGGILQETSRESPDVPKTTPGYVNGTFKVFLHELRVALEVPKDPIIYNTYPINATIYNIGVSDETDVNFELLLDDMTVSSTTIPTLLSGSNYSLNYIWTPTLYDMYNFTAQTPIILGETYVNNNHITEIVPILGPIFYDDFESGLSNWDTITGMWHLTGASSVWSDPYHSPTHSMWFGDETTGTFNSSYQETGELTTIPIDLTGTSVAKLEFYQWREGEGGSYDVSYVYISTDGFNWDLLYQNSDSYIPPWEKVSIDISAYAGNPSVQIRFYFDTLDNILNNYRGWLVDDVSVLGTVNIPHDLRVALEVPDNPEIGHSYMVNATVTNIGTSDESDVNFILYLNGSIIDSFTIPTLIPGASYTLNYMWTVTNYGEFNFTAYAPPITGETITHNNLKTKIFYIHRVVLFDGMFIDYLFTQTGYGTGDSTISYNHVSGSIFHTTWQGSISGMLIDGYWDVDAKTRVITNAGGSNFGSNVHTPFWIFTETKLGDIIPIAVDGEGDHQFNVTGDFLYDLPGVGLVDVWILEDLALPGSIAWYEKSTGLLLYGDFLYAGGSYNYEFDFTDTNASFETIVFEHDLKVTLETPLTNEIGKTYMINATVKNRGSNDEHDIVLLLYLDGLEVSSINIPTLAVGMEQTIQYTWNPTEYENYNFTAYTPPVPLETYIENNIQTKIVSLFETELFNGLYIKHAFTQQPYTYNTEFSYTLLGGSIYQESLELEYMGSYMTYNWQVDALTRVMSGGSAFGDGAHTLAWIFTNTSLYDLVPIAVDGEGDHIFNVTRDLIYNLPGFGPIEVWELKDLTQPGGIAWYEKSTGILLNATFLYGGGLQFYTFDFIDTNANMKIYVPPPDAFTLSSNAENPDEDGKFDLIWTESLHAENYTVYQYDRYISDINGSLTILANGITDLTLRINHYKNGTYYFIVVSYNISGNSTSNCIEITVAVLPTPPDDFTLSSDAGVPDTDGSFNLVWTEALRAYNYSVYTYSGFITNVNNTLTPLVDEKESYNLAQTGYSDGTYYFIVVAHNDFGDTLSNCIKVTVQKPTPIIPGYNLIFLIVIFGVVTSLILRKKLKFVS